jgi:HK97 family phage major capsid protein
MLRPAFGEIYANPAATQKMLDDAVFDVAGWLAQEIAREFDAQEGASFVTGDGINKPQGFLSFPTAATADGTRDFGTLQYLEAVAKTYLQADELLNVVYELKAAHRTGAAWLLNRRTLAHVRKLKDGDGQYVWTAGLLAGQPSMLLGYPVYECEDMPSIAAGAFPVAFGNFLNGYTICDRVGIRVLRDPYSAKPYVQFYTTKRVGGMLTDSEAIKLIKMAAS